MPNCIASIAGNPNQYASANDVFAPYQYSRKDGGLWVKMYSNFERVHAGGMDVGNNAYGTIIGADFGLKDLKHGWQFMPTAYIGYNGAHQYWKGYGAYQNGGQLGVMGTWYKNNFKRTQMKVKSKDTKLSIITHLPKYRTKTTHIFLFLEDSS